MNVHTLAGFAVTLLRIIVSTYLSRWIVEQRGGSVNLWSRMGVIFGPIAPITVALLPRAIINQGDEQ